MKPTTPPPPPVDLFSCPSCGWVSDIVIEGGYEGGQFPTAYEDYFYCAKCSAEITNNEYGQLK